MLRIMLALLTVYVWTPVIAAESPSAIKDTAIINYNLLKEAKLEGTAKNLRLLPVIGLADQVSYMRLQNQLTTPRVVKVSITELVEPEYDLYIDGAFISTMKKEDIEKGFDVKLAGTSIPPYLRDYFSRLRKGAGDGAKRFTAVMDKDSDRCKTLLEGVSGWIDTLEKNDRRMQTVSIIVAPSGRPFSLPALGLTVESFKNFDESVRKVGDAVQMARADIRRLVDNHIYRYDALNAITPLDLSIISPPKLVPGKHTEFHVALINRTDRPVKMKIKLNLPSNWKVRPINNIATLNGYADKVDAVFMVVPPRDIPKTGLTVTADLDLKVQDLPLKLFSKVVVR